MSEHPTIHKQGYDLRQAIEQLPASEQRTKIAAMAGRLHLAALRIFDALMDVYKIATDALENHGADSAPPASQSGPNLTFAQLVSEADARYKEAVEHLKAAKCKTAAAENDLVKLRNEVLAAQLSAIKRSGELFNLMQTPSTGNSL